MSAVTTIPYDDIVWACTHLCELLEYENEALAAHDAATVRELTENKAALARIYEQAVAPMADEPHLVDTLEPEQKEELMGLGSRLKDLVEENARRIKAEMDAYQMLMDAVVGAVKTSKTTAVTYGRAGHMEGHGVAENSISLNQTL
ncbi:MAG TPA: flagellar protein FlgN [Magnetospirillum sp.]|nr:flagellar protein FlgN [Magnetospirillum sp.]